MVLCRRRGCGAEFSPAANGVCVYHPGTPVFHEGLKAWSCCRETNKPVLEFDEFLKIRGCAEKKGHTEVAEDAPPAPAPKAQDADVTGATAAVQNVSLAPAPAPAPMPAPAPASSPNPRPEPRDPDSLDAVAPGMRCHRQGCTFTADAAAPRDRGAESCRFHPGAAIFHEGSKGYTCCKRRVLEFDEFLRIAPCTAAQHGHLFSAPPAPVNCRIDHYETPNDVRVTVYARGVDREQSTIAIRADAVDLALQLGDGRRFERTLVPYAEIDAAASSYTIGSIKVELVLAKKARGVSWPALERTDHVAGYGLTFGRA